MATAESCSVEQTKDTNCCSSLRCIGALLFILITAVYIKEGIWEEMLYKVNSRVDKLGTVFVLGKRVPSLKQTYVVKCTLPRL